jgi:hypothetical protein
VNLARYEITEWERLNELGNTHLNEGIKVPILSNTVQNDPDLTCSALVQDPCKNDSQVNLESHPAPSCCSENSSWTQGEILVKGEKLSVLK